MLLFKVLVIVIGILVLGVLVLIHEMGHFLAAKSCGIRVLSFSIGFGKPIFSKTIGETDYRISLIPFGGYVHMAGEHPEDDKEEKGDEFTSKPVWQRAFVAIAGPLANILFSLIFLWVVFFTGFQRNIYLDNTTVGFVKKDSPSWNAGFITGDSLVSLNGKPIVSWDKIHENFAMQNETYSIEILRNNEKKILILHSSSLNKKDLLNSADFGLKPPLPAVIGNVLPKSPADVFGIKPQDKIITVDSQSIHSWDHFSSLISSYKPSQDNIQLSLMRNGSLHNIMIKPEYNEKYDKYMLGVSTQAPETKTIRYSIIGAIPKSIDKAIEDATMIFRILPTLPKRIAEMVTKPTTPSGMSGPIGIVQISGIIALGGFSGLLEFMALIGINLGILNLFPLIITDGGVLFFLIIESVRRKPLSMKVQLLLNKVAIAFFLTLFIFVTFNDIIKLPMIFRMLGN